MPTTNNPYENQPFIQNLQTLYACGFRTEPENPGEVNSLSGNGGSEFFVKSEATTSGTVVPDGTTINNVGTDILNGGSISVTFFDKGDVARVSDAGSTLGLLFLSLIALLGASRLRSLQLA